MGIEKILGRKEYQVMKANIPAGSRMPVHYATSEAFVMVTKGTAELIFSDRQQDLEAGMHVIIAERKPHTLKIRSDFEAFIVIGGSATIEFNGGTQEAKDFAAAI